MRVLITRPEPDGARTAAAATARGHTPMVTPLLRLEPLAWTAPVRQPQGLLITSANALRALGGNSEDWRDVPVLAVGARTAAAARAAGFVTVRSADGDVADLAVLAGATFAAGSTLLHLTGADQAGDLPGVLAVAGIQVETAVVYRMVAAERFPTAVRGQLAAGTIEAVLHFSRRTAQVFVQCATQDDIAGAALALVHACLSEQVAGPLAESGAQRIRVANHPDESVLLDCLDAAPHERRVAGASAPQ